MRYLLDTNVCIRYLNGQSDRIRQQLSEKAPEQIVLCSVVKAELFYGARKSQNVARFLKICWQTAGLGSLDVCWQPPAATELFR